MNANQLSTTDAWKLIEADRRRDRLIRRIGFAAWSTTFVMLLIFGAMTALQVLKTMRLVAAGALPTTAIVLAATPFVAVVGVLSLIVATLSTVAVFLRLRTASLAEIQLRLAALEQAIAGQA